jgi:hypothetical protein
MTEIKGPNMIEITGTVELQEPIAGVDYSKNGFTLSATKYILEEDEKEMHTKLYELLETSVKIYFDRLKDQVQSTRNNMIDELRIEIEKEYEEKLKEAKKMILDQREQIKLLKNK